jgi:Carboxypeptidase regulatory-like domain
MTAALWFFLWLIGPQSVANSIQGVAVRAGTDQPLVGETVGLWPTNRTAKTDEAGRFLFRDVSAGDYVLTVLHDGIKLRVPITLTAAQRFENVTLEVKSAPAISGSVFDPNGERVAAARVQAFRTVYSVNGPRVQSVMSVATDDLGEFRLFWLRAGEYYVSASLNDRDQKIATSGLRLSPNLSSPDEGFPTLYFGQSYSQYTSQKVRLTPETDATGVQIFFKEGPRFNINARLVSSEPSVCARVALVPEGGLFSPDDFASYVCNSFRIRGVSPGTYFILATNDLFASDVTRVSVIDRDPDDVVVTLVRSVDIPGRVSRDIGTAGLSGVNVTLSRNSREVSQEIKAPVAADGTFTIPSVGPGNYGVSITPLPDKSYIRSIPYRATDGLGGIRVDSTAGRLDIQLSTSNATAEGIVVDRSARPVPGAEVVLVPRAFRARPDRYKATTADAGGNFRVTGIPPGDYVAFAFEELEPQAYYAFSYDPGLFTRYVGQGKTLDPGGNPQMRLIAIPASETAGGFR